MATNGKGDKFILFDSPLKTVPVVVTNVYTGYPDKWSSSITDIDIYGFNLHIESTEKTDTLTMQVLWIAVA